MSDRPTSQAVTPTESRKCPTCGTKLIPASQAFSEIRERITAAEPPGVEYTEERQFREEVIEHLEERSCVECDKWHDLVENAEGRVEYWKAQVASLSSQLARQQATYEAWGRAFSDEELSSMQEQNNWNQFEASLFKTCQRLSSQLELARDSAAEYEAERNEAGARARAAESSLERLKAEQLTAEEAKALLDGMLEEDLADQAAYEAHTRGFKKLRQISYGSDTGAHP